MPNTNPRRELLCPICPKKLHYVTTRYPDGHLHQKREMVKVIADIHVYECPAHGRFHMGPNQRLVAGA